MASGNESQGLKIAVAIFVSLSVILGVLSYFMYSEYAKASEQMAAAKSDAQQKTTAAAQALNDFKTLRDRAGYRALNDPKAVIDEITKDQQVLVDKINASAQEQIAAITKSQQAGASAAELETYRGNLQQIVQRFQDESTQDPTFKSSLDTEADLVANQARLVTALALDNVKLRSDLAQVDSVNKAELDVQTNAARKSSDDLNDQVTKYEQIRQDQMVQIDRLQTERAQLIAEVDRLTNQVAQSKEQYEGEITDLTNNLRNLRTEVEKKENVLDVPDGKITYVDYGRKQVITNVKRSQGARPQMILSVFDADSPGLPTEKVKARIKLIQVGEQESIGEIDEQMDPRSPLRAGDQLYSAAWSPNEPQRFALIGKIDMNQDGRDDRKDLIALIQAAGGTVEYDLPPPGVGAEKGELTPRAAWYVIDEREPIRTPGNSSDVEKMTEADSTFHAKRTEAIRNAQRYGVRPLPIARLLASLGYSPGMMIPGKVEAANSAAINAILNPGGLRAPLAPPTSTDEQPN